MKSINEIFRGIVERVSVLMGTPVAFQFGDWDYIANKLLEMGASSATAGKKYPIVCLRSPYTEHRSGKERSVNLEFLIAVNTLQEYTNEQREQTSFEEVLRPLYSYFMKEISRSPYIKSSYVGSLPHDYLENYRYGRLGVKGGDGNRFRDFIDAIELKNLSITIKEKECV